MMPKRKKQHQQPSPPQQQSPHPSPLPAREEPGDEEDESHWTTQPSGPSPMTNGKTGSPKSDKFDHPVCRHFAKKGHCRYEDLCAFYHPGVNGPPL
eukprot:bmy_19128T0